MLRRKVEASWASDQDTSRRFEEEAPAAAPDALAAPPGRPRVEVVAQGRLGEGARRLGEVHGVAGLHEGQRGHETLVVGVAELVGQGRDVGKAAAIGKEDIGLAGLGEARAVGTGSFGRKDPRLDAAASEHGVDEVSHGGLHRGVGRAHEVEALAEGVGLRLDGAHCRSRREEVVAGEPFHAEELGLEAEGLPAEIAGRIDDGHHRLEGGLFHVVHGEGRVEEAHRRLTRTHAVFRESVAGEGVEDGGEAFPVDLEGRGLGPEGSFAHGAVGGAQQRGDLGEAHVALDLRRHLRRAMRRLRRPGRLRGVGAAVPGPGCAGYRVIEPAPGLEAVRVEARDDTFLGELEEAVAELAGLPDGEGVARGAGRGKEGIGEGVGGPGQEEGEGGLGLVDAGSHGGEDSAEFLGLRVLAIEGGAAIRVGPHVVEEGLEAGLELEETQRRLEEGTIGRGVESVGTFKRLLRSRGKGFQFSEEGFDRLEVSREGRMVEGGIFGGEVPGGAFRR